MLFSRITRIKPLFILVCLVTGWMPLAAQVNAVSPLTVFGLGDLSEGYFAQNFGLGGTSAAVREPLYINIANPASYSALEYTTLEVAVSQKFIQQRIQATNQELNNQNAYFNYFGLGFKINEWWGATASLAPYSFVGYNIYTTDSVAEFGDILYEFQGTGGINQVVLGNAFEPIKNLSIGINVRYLFGSWDKSAAIVLNNSTFYNSKGLSTTGVSSFAFDYGAQYTLSLANQKRLVLGGTFANQINLNAIQSSVKYSFLYNAQGIQVPMDTLSASLDVPGTITLPSRYSLGFSYGKTNENYASYAWMITGEYASTQWSKFRDINEIGGLNNSFRTSVGGYFIPAYAFEGSKRAKTYFSIVEYRFGGFFEQTQLQLGGKDVTNYGITMGLGLPVFFRSLAPGEKKSTIFNFGIVVGNKGNGQTDQINERYINLLFGLTLGDQWFQKFKFR